MIRTRRGVLPVALILLLSTACGDASDSGGSADERPTIVTTTNILGDVVGELVGDEAEVVTIMPVGADPHTFQASAQEAAEMREADALVVNGGGLEEGLLEVIEGAEDDGVPVYEGLSEVDTLELGAAHEHEDEGEHGHEEGEQSSEREHGHEEGEQSSEGEHEEGEQSSEGEHGHEHEEGSVDPHFFTDPDRMAVAAQGIADFLVAEVPALDTQEFRAGAEAYIGQLEELDTEVEAILAEVPDERRVMITNHEAFGYFAERYGFEIVGTIIPGGSTGEAVSAGELAELAELIEAEGVPAIFAETTEPGDLADTLADEVGGDVEVVELYTGSLGEQGTDADTYFGYVRTNAELVADALA